MPSWPLIALVFVLTLAFCLFLRWLLYVKLGLPLWIQ